MKMYSHINISGQALDIRGQIQKFGFPLFNIARFLRGYILDLDGNNSDASRGRIYVQFRADSNNNLDIVNLNVVS